MPRILGRYLLREVVLTSLVVTGILLALLVANQLAVVLERAVEDEYPHAVLFRLIGLGALQYVSIVLPVGLLLGVVLALGRLYHDSEMTSMFACGVRPGNLYGPIVGFAVLVAAIVAWLTLFLAPHATAETFSLRGIAARAGQFAPVTPGKFRSFGDGDTVVYAEGANPDGTLANVFIERRHEDRVEVTLARRARHVASHDGSMHTITLYDGERFEGMAGKPSFRIVYFAEQVIPVRVHPLGDSAQRLEAVPSGELWRSSDPQKRAELHGRISLPLMCVVLTLLAIPLSRLKPRQGRYSRVWLAVLIYFVYSNLITAGQVWLGRGLIPQVLGLWWAHAAVIATTWLVVWLLGAASQLHARTA